MPRLQKAIAQGGSLFSFPSICVGDLAALGFSDLADGVPNPDTIWNYELGAKTEWPRNIGSR